MSRKWHPAAPRIGGTSPKDRNVVVGGGSRELDSGQARLRAAENLYHKRCEEVIKQHLAGYDGAGDVVEFMTEAAYLAMTEAELPTSLAGDDQTKTKERIARAALVAATAAILVGTVIVASQIDQAVVQATGLVAQATAGALVGARVGGAKGGAVGAFAGLAASLPVVGARNVGGYRAADTDTTSSVPSRTPKSPSSQHLKTAEVPKNKILGKYDPDELTFNKDRIYIATPEGGDWAFVPGNRLVLLSEVFKEHSGNSIHRNTHFVLIKNSQLQDLVTRGDEKGFNKLMIDSRDQLRDKIADYEIMFRSSMIDIVESKRGYTITYQELEDELVDLAVKFLSIQRDVAIVAVDKASLEYRTLISRDRRPRHHASLDVTFHQILKKHLLDHAYKMPLPRFSDQKIESVFNIDREKTEQTFYDFQRQGVDREDYDDRLLKFKLLAPETDVIVIDEKLSREGWHDVHGLNVGNERSLIVFTTSLIDPRTLTHELMHVYDTHRCDIVDGKLKFYSPTSTVCGSDVIDDGSIYYKARQAYEHDFMRLEKMGEILPYYGSLILTMRHTMVTGRNSHEVIPTVTDFLDPFNLLHLTPNIAVVRTGTILQKDFPEAQFYAAMLRCDKEKVDSMIKQDPSIMNKKYDGISLHRVAKILKKVKYDELVTGEIKVNKEISFNEISDFVSQKYSEYKKSFVHRVSDKNLRTEHSHNDL